MRRMKATLGSTAFGYVSLLSYSRIISRFGRQARLGEHVDSGLTAYRHSEFATLDKMRLRYKTRLGRFITSPRLACRPPLAPPQSHFTCPFLGTDPVLRGPRKVCQKHIVILIFFAIIAKMVIQCGTLSSFPCFAQKRFDFLA